jgi:hypothetical protein
LAIEAAILNSKLQTAKFIRFEKSNSRRLGQYGIILRQHCINPVNFEKDILSQEQLEDIHEAPL